MLSSRLSIIICIGLILFALPASAQTRLEKPKAPSDNAAATSDSVAEAEADYIRKGRREQARWLLFALGGDARNFRDEVLRARSLTRIADALWDVAEEQGRMLFREAWAAAGAAGRENQNRSNLHEEVLRLAARRDRLLAEEFLQNLKTEQQEAKAEDSGNGMSSGSSLWRLPEAAEKRLNLAENLLRAGDIERALQFADPVLGSVTISTLDFLTHLREKNPAAADRRYAALVTNTANNASADANTISVLASYIFTPHTYVIFNDNGGADSVSMASSFPVANVSPQLRLTFFQTARAVLLRPQLSPEQERGAKGIVGKYMVLKRLMPLFERYAPKEIADAVRAQFEALNSLLSDTVRQTENEWIEKGISPDKQIIADQESTLWDQLERTKTADERDEIYFKLALLALGKEDLKARDYVEKINDADFRKRARAWVDVSLAVSAVRKKKIETALELSRIGELTHIQRVWLLTQAAKLTADTDGEKSLLLIEEAVTEADRIDAGTPDRARGLLAIANAMIQVEPGRAWEATLNAIKAANSAERFTGEGGTLTIQVNSKSRISRKTEAVPDFDVEGIFGKLANHDYERAVQWARAFQGEAPRVNAVIAIALAVLNDKDSPLPTSQTPTKD